jgi:SAM-dependent methyltransferase
MRQATAVTTRQRVKEYVKAHAPALVPLVRFGKLMMWRLLPMRARFQHMYRHGKWGSRERSSSGTGSNLEQTWAVRERLPALLRELGVRTLLDIPCGDFYWMTEVDLGGVEYLGADIVPEVIAANRERYGGALGRRFVTLDITRDPLPRADLILCRDCLVHLANREARHALENIKRSGSTYLLATTFTSRPENPDVVTGFWRPLNLELPPFALPKPLLTINENCPEIDFPDKSLGLWRIESL